MNTLAKRFSALLGAFGLAAGGAAQQDLSGEFSPSPAPPGESVTFTLTDFAGGGFVLPSPCGWFTIHQGTQDGPMIGLNVACPQVLVPVEPNGSASFTWDQRDQNGNQVPPGRYWFHAQVWDFGFNQQLSEWFCLSIQGPQQPALTAASPATVGETSFLTIESPNDAGVPYLGVMSLTSNNPISVPGLSTCLSQPIFNAPLIDPFGFLGTDGRAILAVEVPNIPQLTRLGFHVQVVLGGGPLHLTNDLSFSIRPRG